MTIHVYLHNGGFPNIHKNSTPVFSGGDTILEIRDANYDGLDRVTREYDVKEIFRINILMEEDEEQTDDSQRVG